MQGQIATGGAGGSVSGSGNSSNLVLTSVSTKGTVGNVTSTSQGGTASIAEGAVQNTVAGSTQSQTATGGAVTVAAGAVQNTTSNTVSTAGTVGNVSTGSATSGNTQNITLNTFDPNSAATTRALGDTEIAVASINAQAAKDVAATNAAALADAARQKIYNTPSVSGPALTSSNDTCMGSTSGSANVPGIGIGFGSSWVDGNCKLLKNSRELWNMGMKAAALALMCKDADNKEALELTGFVCPTKKTEKVSAASTEQYTDPIVRQRLGLAPLVASK